ncbi:hypothetical protein [Rhodococcus sp. B10]|uniref:hypothetical protein n=1 Tax=Rhodococcus sp. B10 TaxID=2695876 RepID=UPI001430E89C|nr:hypothetical protein [Rhodococcus sp. B10]NIL74418.1 hypothetical protein [Rhodococcus sp. B10]
MSEQPARFLLLNDTAGLPSTSVDNEAAYRAAHTLHDLVSTSDADTDRILDLIQAAVEREHHATVVVMTYTVAMLGRSIGTLVSLLNERGVTRSEVLAKIGVDELPNPEPPMYPPTTEGEPT